jgi:inorganic pyrophosphatase
MATRLTSVALLPVLATAYISTSFTPSTFAARKAFHSLSRPSALHTASPSVLPLSQRRPIARGASALRSAYTTTEEGKFPSEEYRVFFKEDGKAISPWHDVDTWADKKNGIVNAIIEITKDTRPKMEVATKEETNPIKQDMKKGKLRDYPLDIYWNYGMIPKTWENPKAEHPEMKAFGDNDPVDIVEIGSKPIARGTICKIKAVGTLAMIDEGELDWKVIGVSTEDPKCKDISSVADMEKAFPGQIDAIREWFRNYKSDGKFEGGKWVDITEGQNSFGLGEECKDMKYTAEVIDETVEQYEALMAGKVDADGLSLK